MAFGRMGDLGRGFGRLGGPLGASSGSAPTHFVNGSTGSDSNNGRTAATAWQTIAKVNASTFAPRDIIAFAGGQTFTDATLVPASGTSAGRVTYTSYGTGNAILSPTGKAVNSDTKEYFTLQNLTCIGSGSTVSTTPGIDIYNSGTGAVMMHNVSLINLTVHGYGQQGINFKGGYAGAGIAGFNNVLISGCNVYDCMGNTTGNTSAACINVTGKYGSGFANNASFVGLTITGCSGHDSPGKADATNWGTGGILVSGASALLIERCTAFNCGANNTSTNGSGSIGIFIYDCHDPIIRQCEAYNMSFINRSNGAGFGIGVSVNALIEQCYAHDNQGENFLLFAYGDGTVSSCTATMRNCISENGGGGLTGDYLGAGLILENDTGGTSVYKVYNNSFYNTDRTVGATAIVELYVQDSAGMSGYFANNILHATGGCDFVVMGGSSFTTPTNMLFRGNDYYNPTSPTYKWLGVTYTSFAAWQTASGQEKISGVNVGLTSDPMFYNPGNGGTIGGYALPAPTAYDLITGSPMIGAGLDLNQFSITPATSDYYGNPNPRSGVYPVGAYGGAGVAPIIDEIFTTGQYYPRAITLELVDTRASTKFVTDASGLLTSVAVNTLPISNAGILVEAAGTNILLHAQTLDDAAWNKYNASITADQIAAPDGTTTADLFTDTVTNIAHAIYGTLFNLSDSTTYALSVYLKAGTLRYISVRGDNFAGNAYPWITLDTTLGTIAANGSVTSNAVEPLGNGWFRVSLTWTQVGGIAGMGNVVISGSDVSTAPNGASSVGNVYAGTGQTFYVWGVDLKQAPKVSSYVPTVATSAARAADSVVIQRTGIGRIVFTFDDDSTQTVSGIDTGVQYTIPTSLNRALIKRMTGYAS